MQHDFFIKTSDNWLSHVFEKISTTKLSEADTDSQSDEFEVKPANVKGLADFREFPDLLKKEEARLLDEFKLKRAEMLL